MTLYHYTCDHGRKALGESGTLTGLAVHSPNTVAKLRPLMPDYWPHVVWATDLDTPIPAVLGLTSSMLQCDRTRYRYRVTDETALRRWIGSPERRRTRLDLLDDLERYGLPAHWWVATDPVPVELDPA
jgi:hypothetical protein